MVSQENLAGHWHTIVGAVKEKFGQITGDDLTRVQGNFDQLVGLLERKTGQTKEKIESFLDDCCSTAGTTYKRAAQKGAELYNQAGEVFDDGFHRISEHADQGYRAARDAVAKRPMESVAVVAGLGLLAGIAIGVSMASRRRY